MNDCEGAGGSSAKCRDSTCEDLQYDEVACGAKTDTGKPDGTKICTYDESGICYTTGQPIPCKEVYEEETCTKQPDCAFDSDDYVCYEKGNRGCDTYVSDTGCTGASGCAWWPQMMSCKKSGEEMPCSAFAEEGDCPAARGCEYKEGMCWEKDKDIPCAAFCSAFTCENSGQCLFDQTNFACKPCEGGNCPAQKACKTYTSEETCPEAHCEFIFNEAEEDGAGVAGVCQDRSCTSVYTSSECGSKDGCQWYAGKFSGEGNCFVKGYDLACNMLYEEDACGDKGCTWDSANYRCNEKGATTPCELFTVDECPATRCKATEYECQIDPATLPSEPPTLSGAGDGTGNEDSSKCTPAKHDAIKAKLESAESECFVHGRKRSRRDDKQLECLEYFLHQTPSIDIIEACPCLWFWGKQVSPGMDHWMQIPC